MILVILFLDCYTINKLEGYEFRDRTAAALMIAPPPPMVFSEMDLYDEHDTIITQAIKIGTAIAKEVEAVKAQQRLRDALAEVDISEYIRQDILWNGSDHLHYDPVDDQRNADYTYVIKIEKYGIEAPSWFSSIHFVIDLRVRLMDAPANKLIWRRKVVTREPVSSSIFGISNIVGDIVSAAALADLTEEELAQGFENLAAFGAGRVAEILYEDFLDAQP
jgi:hypothetical protein